MNLLNIRSFEKKVIDFINKINQNYTLNEDGFLYFQDRHLAIGLHEKYESSNLYKPTNYFTDLHNNYLKNGIRLISLFDWQIDHEKSWEKIQMLLITAIGNPKRIMSRKCKVVKISNKEAKPINEQFHTMGHRNAQVTYGLEYNGQLIEIMSFSKNKWNRNILSDNSWEIIRGCAGSLNVNRLTHDPNELCFIAGGPSRLLAHFIKDYNPDVIFSYCESGLFNGKSYEKCNMRYAGQTPASKFWICDEIDPETGKQGLVVPRNPARYRELKERSHNTIVWTAGSMRYVWVKPGYEYQGHGKEFLK